MGVVVPLPGAANIHAAWSAYCAAREKAERSGRIEDGIAAGHAWRAWLSLFEARS